MFFTKVFRKYHDEQSASPWGVIFVEETFLFLGITYLLRKVVIEGMACQLRSS